jgi:phosphatidylglycerophosphatase A
MTTFYKLVATGFGLGYLPKAPGTWGSIGAFLVSIILSQLLTDPLYNIVHLFLSGITYPVGVIACKKLIPIWGKDPGKIVVDEICGMWLAYVFCPPSIPYLLLGLVIFRYFDITKILGISKVDELKGAHVIMLDDVIAGLYTGVILYIIYFFDLIPL